MSKLLLLNAGWYSSIAHLSFPIAVEGEKMDESNDILWEVHYEEMLRIGAKVETLPQRKIPFHDKIEAVYIGD